MKIGITFGTFDVFHYGHLRILERSKELCDKLIVGVSSDELNFSKKGKFPIYNYEERSKIIGALKVVDEVFKEESLELKAEYIKQFNASVLIMGDDWEGKFDWVKEHCNVDVIYLPRTPSISTTAIIEKIRN
jgi:glycerol-3-phosphate cytidylyltransferase